jgi:voltage-gated potassium channel
MDYLMLEKSKDVILHEIPCKGIAENTSLTIRQLNSLSKENLNIIGLKRHDGKYIVNPGPDIVLTHNDYLFVLGKPEEIEQFQKAISGEMSIK